MVAVNYDFEYDTPVKDRPAFGLPLVVPNKTKVGYFSFFSKPVRNTDPCKVISVYNLYQLIKSEIYKYPTKLLRTIQSPEYKRNYKATQFDYVTPAGVFAKRANSAQISHSQLIVIDFDHIQDPEDLKKALISGTCFETALIFTSPSGQGIKWFVEIDVNEYTHLQWFLGIQNYMKCNYSLDIDKSGKDLARCCFVCYDPDVYINPNYLPSYE